MSLVSFLPACFFSFFGLLVDLHNLILQQTLGSKKARVLAVIGILSSIGGGELWKRHDLNRIE
jgi:hypothetical protein